MRSDEMQLELELELKVVGALLSFGRPAELSELRAASIRLGVSNVEVEALCELPASPLRLSGGLVTFSERALSFFQRVVSRFSYGGDPAKMLTSIKDREEATEPVFVVATETEQDVRSGNEEMQAVHEMLQTGKEARDNVLSSPLCGNSPDTLRLTYPGHEGTWTDHETGEKTRDNVLSSRLCGKTPDLLQLTYMDSQAQEEVAMVAVTTSFFSSKRLRPTADEVPPSFEDYKVEGLEGSGGFSAVYKAIRLRDDQVFAIKRPVTGHQRRHVETEIRMLNLLGGKHGIVALEEIIRHSNDTCLVLEYIEHDKTETLKQEMTVDEIRSYGFSLFKALSYMHQKNLMHRDVKPANFLFDRKKRVGRLIDFNLAAVADAPKLVGAQNKLVQHQPSVKRPFPEEAAFPNKTAKLAHKTAKMAREPVPTLGRRKLLAHLDKTVANPEGWCPVVAEKRANSQVVISAKAKKGLRKAIAVGTRGYNAPEVLLKAARQTVQVDVWSAGVTLWQLATEELPFSSAGKDQILREIARMRGIEPLRELAKKHSCVLNLSEELKGKPVEEWAANCPTRKDGLTASFFDLVERCLQVDPERRITARDAMRHKFFSPCLKARKRNS